MVKVKLYPICEDIRLPERARDGDACYDVFSVEEALIFPGETKLLHLGFKIGLPDGWEVQMRSKSGLALYKSLFVLNSPGTIDSGYRGEVCVILHNLGENFVYISRGMKIAQMCVKPVHNINFEVVDRESDLGDSIRGSGGFGSSGR